MTFTSSEFQHIYDPSIGENEKWYINDHCFIQDTNGLWHVFGITHQEPAAPLDEKFFAHATSIDLFGEWTKQPHVLQTDPEQHETHVWAPHVIYHDNLYWMFYCAGGPDHEHYRIHLAISKDLYTWERHAENPMVIDGYDARDPMIFRYNDRWLMFYTANSEPSGGYHTVMVVESTDLVHWTDRKEVFRNTTCQGTYAGPTESPFVIERNGKFYLFVCTNIGYDQSAVYESNTPLHWEEKDICGLFPSHAAEVIETPSQLYISRAGWGRGGLHLAKLNLY